MIAAPGRYDDWTWCNALQMAMPPSARLGVLRGESAFADTMYGLHTHTKSRADGFWKVDTAGQYRPIVASAWNGLVTTAVHPDGSLGYAQGVGDRPESSQPGDLRRPAASGRASSYITGPGW